MSVASSTTTFQTQARRRSLLKLYAELTKARLSSLVIMTTAIGYLLAIPGDIQWLTLAATVVGTAMAAACANALNELIEIKLDARMHRTENRPLPSGALHPYHAFVFAIVVGYGGLCLLALMVNLAAAALALLTIVLYALVYTPLKTRTTLNTLVGAVCGAIPPMIGWVAGAGSMTLGAWLLAALLFIWQLPHFLALAWLYREDYRRGGFHMLPVIDHDGALTAMVATISCLALVLVGLMGTLIGVAGWISAAGSIIAGLWFWRRSLAFYTVRSEANARRLFRASLIYLPVVLAITLLDRGSILSTGLTTGLTS